MASGGRRVDWRTGALFGLAGVALDPRERSPVLTGVVASIGWWIAGLLAAAWVATLAAT